LQWLRPFDLVAGMRQVKRHQDKPQEELNGPLGLLLLASSEAVAFAVAVSQNYPLQ